MIFDMDFMTWSLPKAKDSQKTLLRERYYENLSILEYFAVHYGALGVYSKGFLYTALSGGWLLCLFLFYNPIVLTILTVILVFMGFLEYQYGIMDARFERMTRDLEISENQLKEASQLSFDLENQARNCIEKDYELVAHLQETRGKIESTYSRLLSTEMMVETMYEKAESAVENISNDIEKIVINHEDLSLKLKDVKQGLSNLSSLFAVKEHISETSKVIQDTKNLRAHALLVLRKYHAQNSDGVTEQMSISPP